MFYKNLPAREYKFLISEPDFNFNTLKKLLVNNELRDFDPVKEAFKVMGGLCGHLRTRLQGSCLAAACAVATCTCLLH